MLETKTREELLDYVKEAKKLVVNETTSVYFWWNILGLTIQIWEWDMRNKVYIKLNEYGCEA